MGATGAVGKEGAWLGDVSVRARACWQAKTAASAKEVKMVLMVLVVERNQSYYSSRPPTFKPPSVSNNSTVVAQPVSPYYFIYATVPT